MKNEMVTKENFKQFTDKYVSRDYEKVFIGLDMPKNELEFKQFTKAIYGVELGVNCYTYNTGVSKRNDGLDYSCSYEITGLTEREYSKGEIYRLWENKYGQYDGLKILLNTCFGVLTCGGVATYHYGQVKCNKETWERIKNWDSNNTDKLINAIKKQNDLIIDIFGTNPFLK